MTPKAVLLRAAELIEEKGWVRMRALGPNGEMCAMKAIGYAANDGLDEANAACGRLGSLVGQSIPSWNDAPGRTKEEVVAALRKAAEGKEEAANREAPK